MSGLHCDEEDLPEQIISYIEQKFHQCPHVAAAIAWVGLIEMAEVGMDKSLAHSLVEAVWTRLEELGREEKVN